MTDRRGYLSPAVHKDPTMNAVQVFFDKIDRKLDAIGLKLKDKDFSFYPNIIGPVCFIVIAVIFLLLMPSQIAVREGDTITARTFPKMLFTIILVLSSVLLVLEIRKIITHKEIEQKKLNALVEVRTLIILGLLVGYLILLRPLGFIVSSILFGIGMVCYFRVRKWYYYAIVGLSAVFIGILFRVVLNVPLP